VAADPDRALRRQPQSACGTASNQVGPFYCPLDKPVYIDASFFKILEDQFGSSGGPLAQEYVVAHEYGHALQDQLGLLDRAQQDPQGPNSGAGAHRAHGRLPGGCLGQQRHDRADEDTGTPVPQAADEQGHRGRPLRSSAVGDDRIQEATQGRVNPESWTHGSAEARPALVPPGLQDR
jgi:predicted metalloprotease